MNRIKYKYYFFILVTFLSSDLLSQSPTQYGWEWLNPKPTAASLEKIRFADANTGYCVGSNGTIMKTTDGGANWNFLQTWVQAGFYDYRLLWVFNKDSIILKGSNPDFYLSTNGGQNFTAVNSGFSFTVNGMYFRDNMNGYAVGESDFLIKTTNGGNSWQRVVTNLNFNMTAVSFPDNNTGYIAGSKIARTTDGGLSWQTSSAITGANCIYFLSVSTGFIGANKLYMTTNGGSDWYIVSNELNIFHDIYFLNSLTGWAASEGGILKTTDGGSNWKLVSKLKYKSICFADSSTGFGCSSGINGGILGKTNDGGYNWSNNNNYFESRDIYSLYFLNGQTGFYGGTSGNFRKTIDGGHTWSTLLSTPGTFTESIYFFNENTGFIGQTYSFNGGQIRKTTNGGLNWSFYQVAWAVDGIMFANMNTGYALSSGNVIYKTTNSGSSWTPYGNSATWLNGIFVADANRVMAVGEIDLPIDHALIAKTTDGGQNWNVQDYNWGTSAYSVYFTDMNTGYVAGSGGKIFKTTDFGETWISINPPTGYSLYAIQFFNANTGIVSGENGTAFKTTNAGLTWIPYYDITGLHFFTMHCPDQNNCYFGGWYGIMLKMQNGGILQGITHIKYDMPRYYLLNQNYPNPFNPTTKIKFSIPPVGNGRDRSVRIIVYDALGREVQTLVNEHLQPGAYEVEWDGSNYSSGVYYYTLVSDNYYETKKMILIK
jgi:photosystem II stability/assembly factor-like uncharacterized protein